MGLGAGLSLCRLSDPQMVSSGRGLRDPSPTPNYTDEEEGPPFAALLSICWKAFGNLFLTHQFCKERLLTMLPGQQPCQEMGTSRGGYLNHSWPQAREMTSCREDWAWAPRVFSLGGGKALSEATDFSSL